MTSVSDAQFTCLALCSVADSCLFILFCRVLFRFGCSDFADFAGVLAVDVAGRFERGSVAPLSDARPGADDGGLGPGVSETIFRTSSGLRARRT